MRAFVPRDSVSSTFRFPAPRVSVNSCLLSFEWMLERPFKAALWAFHGGLLEKDAQGCPLSLSALLCGFLTVSVPASAPVYCSQLSRSCHSSAQNSPVASISLQGKAKALYGPSPSPSSRCSDVPDTISSYFQPPTHAHTHTCTHTHTHARAHTHTHSSGCMEQPTPPGTRRTPCCHSLHPSFAAFCYVHPRHLHGSHFSFLRTFLPMLPSQWCLIWIPSSPTVPIPYLLFILT